MTNHKRYTREEQLARWARAHELKAKGWSVRDIAADLGTEVGNVYALLRKIEPPKPAPYMWADGSIAPRKPKPAPRAKRKAVIWTGSKRLPGGGRKVYREFTVPPQIAELRDRLLMAFVSGDLTLHGRLCLQMRAELDALKAQALVPMAVTIPALQAAE